MRFTGLYLAIITMLAAARPAIGQATAFDYQGQLLAGGTSTSGLHDFRFRLLDAAAGGNQIGIVQCADNVSVTESRFNTRIDFGAQFDSTSPRFLEIEVRSDTGLGCADTSGYTLLSPRQPMTGTSRATAANVAYSLVAPDGAPANAVLVDAAGRIGIGTATPTHSVHIATPTPTLALHDTDSSGQSGGTQIGYISFRDNANVERGWLGYGGTGDPDFSILNARPSGDIVFSPLGGVGIGTTAPAAMLDVRGDIRLGTNLLYLASVGDVPLRIVRGTVDDLNSGHCASATPGSVPIFVGSGFSVAGDPVHEGGYVVTFDTPFTSVPSIVGSSYWDSFFGGKYVTISSVSSTGFRAHVTNSSGSDICRRWSFIAIGSR